MQDKVKISIAGVHGRMSKALVLAGKSYEGLEIYGVFGRPGVSYPGCTEGGAEVRSMEEAIAGSDVVIDFSTPSASVEIAETALKYNKKLLCGTSGLSEEEENRLHVIATKIPLLYTLNTSLGVNALSASLEELGRTLKQADIEIVDIHHNQKIDVPSGTAILLGSSIARGRGQELSQVAKVNRDGKRLAGEIGFASSRGGNISGTHTILFALEDEVIEITHRSLSRGLFVKGALQAAAWLGQQTQLPARLYTMLDVLST